MGSTNGDVDEKDILNTKDLEELYSWIDSAPLSRPKKNMARDFSDGVSVAEIVHFYMPRMVELHNYVNANSTGQKKINWNMLNRKVFVKLNLKLSDKIIDNVIDAKSGAIEQVLWDLRKKIVEMNPKSLQRSNTSNQLSAKSSATSYTASNKGGKRTPSPGPPTGGVSGHLSRIPTKNSREYTSASGGKARDRSKSADGASYSAGLKEELTQFGNNMTSDVARAEAKAATANAGPDVNANNDGSSLPPAHLIYKGHKMVPSMLLDMKNRQIRDMEVVVNGLQKKVTFLDNLIQLKDTRVEDLTRQLHSLKSKFQELTQTKLPEF